MHRVLLGLSDQKISLLLWFISGFAYRTAHHFLFEEKHFSMLKPGICKKKKIKGKLTGALLDTKTPLCSLFLVCRKNKNKNIKALF